MGKDNYKVYFRIALSIAKKAGKLLMNNFYREQEISYKGRINLVTEMDIRSEELIVSSIKKEFPEHGILAEEGNEHQTGSEFLWLIDPLDGTTNYAHGFGFFCVSIALNRKGKGIVIGVVNAPYLDECYTAVKGEGAYLNGRPVRVSKISRLDKSMIATGFSYDIEETRTNIEYFNRFLLKTQAVRRPGSAAIDMCCVASGKFDGFWELKLYPWDTAAGSLIVEEAGGKVSDFSGNPYTPFRKEILVTNGLIHKDMQEVILSGQ